MTCSVPPADAHLAILLSVQAQAWLAQLPSPVRAHGLAMHAPDVANRIAASWDDLQCTATLLESLLCESVRTMPVVLAAELLRLYDYHVRCRVHEPPATTRALPALGAAGRSA